MNRRKPRRALTRTDVDGIIDVFHHAFRIGLPLNVQVTVMLEETDRLPVAARCAAYDRIKNLIGQFARRHRFETASLWAREIDARGYGEHIHILCHMPPAMFSHFQRLAMGWLAGSTEIDIRRICPQQTVARDGKWHSPALYLAKQMSPQAAFKRPLRRIKGGIIEGLRWGMSRNLRRP
ncbi:MAG: hypothetical protein JNM13_11110 [Hyphomicrobiaceae bacterium]|nr:hypothetical protein [Hyphomicrobiaceae bacterium]